MDRLFATQPHPGQPADPPAADGLPPEDPANGGISSPLTELLAQESGEISARWARALHHQSGSHYARVSLAELEQSCALCLAAYRALIERRDQAPLRQFIVDISRRRAALGFTLVELQRAFLMPKGIVRPLLLARHAAAGDLAAFAADWHRFEHAVDIAILRFSEYYHVRLTADLARQLARENKLSSQLAELATHDELTGLHNYRFFADRLREEVLRSERYGRPLALLMADIDHFKQVNDSFGHQIGNLVLLQVAQALVAGLRTTDLVARYGGEEFVVLLPETEVAAAALVAETLRVAVAAGHAPDLPPITISLGVSAHQPGDPTGALLVAAADAALYQAKEAGRNRVMIG